MGKRVYCAGDVAITHVDYSAPGHPRNVHEDGSLCDHSGGVSIGDDGALPQAAGTPAVINLSLRDETLSSEVVRTQVDSVTFRYVYRARLI